jgi:hypothetical protein
VILLQILSFAFGLLIVFTTLVSAIRTFVLPRSSRDFLSVFVFIGMRRIFGIPLHWARSYEDRDRIMAFFAPVSVLMLLPIWLIIVLVGYMFMYNALGVSTVPDLLALSGSSLLTLGTHPPDGIPLTLLAFSEATIGLLLVALLIAYIPTIYTAFARREASVTLLEVRAGSPPSAAEMITRYQRIHGLNRLLDVWTHWEQWFADIEESHTSLAMLSFFRSPRPNRSWITAAGAVLDTAAFVQSALDVPSEAQAALCIRAGFLALRHVADFFLIPYNPDPKPDDPISISRLEFNAVLDQLQGAGVPLKADRDKAWKDFRGWRVNYDTVLLALAALTMAPYAPWSSDRSLRVTSGKRKRLGRAGSQVHTPR